MGQEVSAARVVDCVGLHCPAPVMNTREAMLELGPGEVLEVIADDLAAEQDIPRWAKRTGHILLKTWKENDEIHFLIQKQAKEGEGS